MTNLPDLSRLVVNGKSKAATTKPLEAPRSDQIPKIQILNLETQTETIFGFGAYNYPSLFADEGMIFSCVDKRIVMDSQENSKRALDYYFEQDDFSLYSHSNYQGSFNYTSILDRDDQTDEPGIQTLHNYVEYVKGARVESVAVRTSQRDKILESMRVYDRGSPDIANTKDRLFQELFLTLYAAHVGVGPDIYACQMRSLKRGDIIYPRVVYVVEAGATSLSRACELVTAPTFLKPTMDLSMPDKLLQLIDKASRASILMLDIKPGNIVARFGPDRITFTDLKFIDFATDFATYVHGVDTECIKFANCIMLALMVGAQSYHRIDLVCMMPMMKPIFKYLLEKQTEYDGLYKKAATKKPLYKKAATNKALCMQVQQAMLYDNLDERTTLMDENGNISKIVSAMTERAIHYALHDSTMADPIDYQDDALFSDYPYDPTKPLFRQLIQNFLIFYQDGTGLVGEDEEPYIRNLGPRPRRNPPRSSAAPKRYRSPSTSKGRTRPSSPTSSS